MLTRKERKKIAHFFGRDYDYYDDIIDNLLIPCGVAAITAFLVTLLLG